MNFIRNKFNLIFLLFIISFLIYPSVALAINPCFKAELGLTTRHGDEPLAWHGFIGSLNAGIKISKTIRIMLGGVYGTSPFYSKEYLPLDVYPPLWEEKTIANEKLLYANLDIGGNKGFGLKFGRGWWSQTVRHGQGDSLHWVSDEEIIATTLGVFNLFFEPKISFANIKLRFELGVIETEWFKRGCFFISTKISFGN